MPRYLVFSTVTGKEAVWIQVKPRRGDPFHYDEVYPWKAFPAWGDFVLPWASSAGWQRNLPGHLVPERVRMGVYSLVYGHR